MDFDIYRHINWYAVPHPWLELPLLQCLDRAFIQTEPEAANDAQDVHCALAFDDRFKNDRAFAPRTSRCFCVLRLDTLENRGRGHTRSLFGMDR